MRMASIEAWRRFASCRSVRADLAATATTQISATGSRIGQNGQDRSGETAHPRPPSSAPAEAEEHHRQEPDQRQDTGHDLDGRDPRLRLRARI
jgi:hypothetical protein